MPDDTKRCEPPEGLRDRDGWHWIKASVDEEPRMAKWTRHRNWRQQWTGGTPTAAAANGYRYISPVPDPADVARLVRAVRAARIRFEEYAAHHIAKPDMEKAARNYQMANDLIAALTPFADWSETDGN